FSTLWELPQGTWAWLEHFAVVDFATLSVHLGEVTRNSTLSKGLHGNNDNALPDGVVDTRNGIGSVLKLVLVVLILKNSHRNTAGLYTILLLPPYPALADKTTQRHLFVVSGDS